MKELPSLSAYLKSEDVNDATSAETINTIKKNYWKLYHQHYYQKRKNGFQRLTLRLTDEEYKRLQDHAQGHEDISFSSFIKESALAYLEQQYVPRDSETTNELVKSIRKTGRVINQVVQSFHRATKYRNNKNNSKNEAPQRKDGGEQYYGSKVTNEKHLEKLQREYKFLVKRVSDMENEVRLFMTSPPKKVGQALIEILEKDRSKTTAIRKLLDDIEQKINE